MKALGQVRTIFGGLVVLSWQVAQRLHTTTTLRVEYGGTADREAFQDESVLIQRRAENTTIPAPVVASVSQYWEGNDGPWSSFAIQVGNKPQLVRVLPSTASTSTWVVYQQGCPADAPSNCGDSRGGIFNPNISLTWVPNSIFDLGIEENLGYDVYGDYAFDTVTLGWQGSGGPTVQHSIVAGIGDTAFSWLGVLPLNPRPTNFTTIINTPQVSYVQTLRNQDSIPSVSWSYTAGAAYRSNKVFGSLVFGGYDTSRFVVPSTTSSNLSFPFYTDIARDLLVGISSITTSNTTSSSSSATLLKDGIFALIDSTVPHLWLPESVCEAFESAFGLTWNSTSEQYLINSTQHDTISKLNPSISFTISPQLPPTSSSSTVSIVFPYSAFMLNASWPHVSSSSYYFPLKRAANDTQYTLGRAFLQEAYLIADYERSNFSVWPCSWNSNTNNANIVTIRSVNDTSTNGPGQPGNSGGSNGKKRKTGLSTGAIAGIAVGVGLGIIGAIAGIFLYLRHRRRRAVDTFELDARGGATDLVTADTYPQKQTPAEELDSNIRHELTNQHKFGILEAPPDAERKIEMEDTGVPAESGGQEIEIHEMEAPVSGQPHIFVEPPTALSPGPEASLPSAFSTPPSGSTPNETGHERRLGHEPEEPES